MAGSAQQPDALPGVRRPSLAADSLRLRAGPNALLWLRSDPVATAAQWAAGVRRQLAARAERRWAALRLGDSTALASLLPAATLAQMLAAPPEAQTSQRGVSLLGQYADLGIQLNALIDLRFERLRNLRCTAGDLTSFAVGCREGFTPPRIDPQFNVRSGGVVGQRVHLNVDYDTQREFEASNNIQVYYEGLADEILRRVEVGNVSFAAPQSRFITGGIPSNNFGLALQGQLGALNFGAIYAQQKGNVVRERVFSVGDQTLQPVDRLVADRDFEPQRFFFVRNPRALPGYPALDVLELVGAGLPDSVRIEQVRIYRYRATINRPASETNIAGIPAVALRGDSPQRAGPLNWEVLIEGRDYYLDPSGLWFALAQRVDQDDYLAVSYITARGDTVGTFPAAAVAGVNDTLELIHEPRRGPDVPTFFYELRNVYRIGALEDITRSSVSVAVLVGGSQRPAAGAPTFLSLLGLAQETDASRFDEYNRLFPRSRDPNSGSPLREYYVVFPSLTPFADSTRLPPEYRTDSLYRTPGYLLRTQGPSPLFEIGLHYDAKGGDTRGNLMLGGYQIRQGSERVQAGGRLLTRNVDYTINYETGQLSFVNPDGLFRQPTQVTVQFEENAAFAVAPTNVMGLQARYEFGDHGSISALAITQRQRTTFTRPPLGFEPASNLVAGITGNFRFAPLRLTRLLDALPLVSTEAPSALSIDAEIATSRPSPNQLGVAYVETFEGEAGLFLPLGESSWEFGSRPSSPHGLTSNGVDPAGFSDNDAVLLTWQSIIPAANDQAVQLRAQDIDPTIRVQGTGQQFEAVLWMALKPDTVSGLLNRRTFRSRWQLPHTPGPRWRTITQPLSASGLDLSRIEFLEFWVLEDTARTARNAGLTLAFDFGTVHEDAVDFQPTQFTVGTDTIFSGRRRAGEGRIDTERDTLTGTFNAAQDDLGILGDVADSLLNADNGEMVRNLPLCRSALADSLQFYTWGSELQHCTRRNGQLDTEDLNNDQHLDTLIAATGEAHFRYVVPIGDLRYEVRTGGVVPGVGRWHLYRVPFRADTFQVGTPDIRQIRAVRLAVVAPDNARPESTVFFAVSRMRLVGAPWVKRAGTPIAGLAGNRGELHGEVIASVVSTENVNDLGYTPPPGVVDQGQNIDPGTVLGGTQINERSLRLLAFDLRAGERAEAYFRFPEGNRNFLGYRQLRLWARGRGAGWDARELQMFVKVGQDENNFYLYRGAAQTAAWTPEVVVDFSVWHLLRAQVERAYLQGQPPSGAAQCGGDTLAWVACSGPYVVHVRHPTIAPPNLTRVQELAVGVVRDSGAALDTAELWIDDIRLSGVVNTPGYAGSLNVALAAGDVADIIVGATRRDGDFRQLGENPSYVGSSQLGVNATVRLERFGLERLGLAMPLTIRSDRTTQDPYYINGTDVLAEGLGDVRRPVTASTNYSLNIRRTRRGARWWEKAVVDNLAFTANWSSGRTISSLSSQGGRISDLRASYQVAPGAAGFRYLPGFLRSLLEGLPAELRNSDMVRGLREGRLRVTPTLLSWQSGLSRTSSTMSSFRVPIFTPLDQPAPIHSSTAMFRNTGALEMRPFQSMSAGVTLTWDRDLRDYGDSTVVARLASDSRSRLLGLDIGFMRQRQLATRWSWTPPVASWLRPRIGWNTAFLLSRDPTSVREERSEGDSAGAFRLPTTFAANSSLDLSASLDFSRMLRGPFRDSSVVRSVLNRITQFTLARRIDDRSQFDRSGFDPSLGYQLGLAEPRVQRGRPANAASETVLDRLSFAVRAPLGLTITGAYSDRDASTIFLRGDALFEQRAEEREWPNVTTRWLWSPRTGPLRRVLTSITASAGYLERSSLTDAGGETPGASLRSQQTSRSLPLSLGLFWAPRINTTVSLSRERSVNERSGNTARGDRRNTSADVNFSFRTPREIVPLPGDVRTNLRWQRAVNHSCLERVGLPECLVIADSRRNEYNLTMDTDLPPSLNAGLSVAYVLNDDRHLNRKFSQFSLTVSARFFFNAGEVR